MPNEAIYTNHLFAHSNIHAYTVLSHVTMLTMQLPAALVNTDPSDPTYSHTSLSQ